MTFYEKLVEKAKEMGYQSATKFFDAAEVNTNARLALKKTGRLSDTYKMRCARVLKCSVGDINALMAEARKEELQQPVKAEAVKPEPIEAEPIHIHEEQIIGEPAVDEVAAEEITAPEPTEDDIVEEKIAEIVTSAAPLLTYHDRIKEAAKVTLEAEYAAMLRSRMLAVAISDLSDLCAKFVQAPAPNKAVEFREIASEIIKLKEEKQ